MREESGSIKADGSPRWELAGGKRLPFMQDVSRPLSPGADDVTLNSLASLGNAWLSLSAAFSGFNAMRPAVFYLKQGNKWRLLNMHCSGRSLGGSFELILSSFTILVPPVETFLFVSLIYFERVKSKYDRKRIKTAMVVGVDYIFDDSFSRPGPYRVTALHSLVIFLASPSSALKLWHLYCKFCAELITGDLRMLSDLMWHHASICQKNTIALPGD